MRAAGTAFLLSAVCTLLACGGGAVRTPWPVVEAGPPPTGPPLQPPAQDTGRVEILWDTWGVPHIYAQDEVALLWAFGWAQMTSHADLLLRLYGQARGRAAEYWGEDWRDSDVWVLTNGIPDRAADWLAQQDPLVRAYLEAFAEGINAYARTYPDSIDRMFRPVLPVSAVDVLAHAQRVLHFTFVTGTAGIENTVRAWRRTVAEMPGGAAGPDRVSRSAVSDDTADSRAGGSFRPSLGPIADDLVARSGGTAMNGSNGWAVSPARSASGNAMLLINPHLPWGDLFTWYEVQLVMPGLDAYGAALVGMPLPGIAFNERVGWTHTVNTIDAADLYELRLTPDARGRPSNALSGGAGETSDGPGPGYAWDGGVRPLETEDISLRVRQTDGSYRTDTLHVARSIHGPVVARRGDRALALRVAGLDAAGIIGQLRAMLRASDMPRFETALADLQLPMFTVLYADRDGHILHVFDGRVPLRPRGDWRMWAGVVPGDTSAMLWTAVHAYRTLPRVADPPSGWLQNANDPPWTTTFPRPLRPPDFPAYMAPVMSPSFRAQRSARMLAEDTVISFADIVAYKHSTRVESADHILEDLVLASRAYGTDRARRAADVLEAWDRTTGANSRGAVLYATFFDLFTHHRWPAGSPYDVSWTEEAPYATPDGLSDAAGAAALLDAAADSVDKRYGALDVMWGRVHRLQRDGVDLPASGGPGGLGVFRVFDFSPAADGRLAATAGDSFVAIVEFGPAVRASALLGYGNASQPGSPHRTDQLELLAHNELRPVWLTRAAIEAHLAGHDRF